MRLDTEYNTVTGVARCCLSGRNDLPLVRNLSFKNINERIALAPHVGHSVYKLTKWRILMRSESRPFSVRFQKFTPDRRLCVE